MLHYVYHADKIKENEQKETMDGMQKWKVKADRAFGLVLSVFPRSKPGVVTAWCLQNEVNLLEYAFEVYFKGNLCPKGLAFGEKYTPLFALRLPLKAFTFGNEAGSD